MLFRALTAEKRDHAYTKDAYKYSWQLFGGNSPTPGRGIRQSLRKPTSSRNPREAVTTPPRLTVPQDRSLTVPNGLSSARREETAILLGL